MKKLLTIASLLLLVSCGSNTPSKQKLSDCVELGNCETLVETPVAVTAEITKNGNTFEYVGTETSDDIVLIRYWSRINLVIDGKIWHKFPKTTFTITGDAAHILNQFVIINPATNETTETQFVNETFTTSVELENGNIIVDDNGIDVTIELL